MKHKPNILVVGSFVLDQIATTSVFPAEGETVLGDDFHKAPGGKGANQAVQASLLGADVTMVGKLGCDSNAEEMLNACHKAGLNTQHVMCDARENTGCSVIILEKAADGSTKNRIIVISGANMAIHPEDVAFLKDEIAQYDMVVLQLEIPMEINELVCLYAHERGVPVMLNPAPSAPLSKDLLARLTYISPNEHEAESMTGIHIRNEDGRPDMEDARRAAQKLLEQGVENVIITLGSGGAVLLNRQEFLYCPCVKDITAADPTAAGDSFVASFCFAVCAGADQKTALSFAANTAALTVSRLGAMPSLPTFAEVKERAERSGLDMSVLE